MTPEQEQEIIRLRGLNLSPKQIARQLTLRPAEVSAFIQVQASQQPTHKGKLAPLHHCLINENAGQHLLAQAKKNRSLLQRLSPKVISHDDDDQANGLAQIFVTRVDRGTYFVSSYLVDYWCLGVKSTFGPRKMDAPKYERMVQSSYQTFAENSQEITLKEAQSIIFGAIDYADRLGFEPDPDFERSKLQLGDRYETLLEIEFGKDGQPFYMDGPHDRPAKVIETLERTVGAGNFHYIVQAGSLLGQSDRLFQ